MFSDYDRFLYQSCNICKKNWCELLKVNVTLDWLHVNVTQFTLIHPDIDIFLLRYLLSCWLKDYARQYVFTVLYWYFPVQSITIQKNPILTLSWNTFVEIDVSEYLIGMKWHVTVFDYIVSCWFLRYQRQAAHYNCCHCSGRINDILFNMSHLQLDAEMYTILL